jgi:hypothetical protein
MNIAKAEMPTAPIPLMTRDETKIAGGIGV